MIRIAPTRDSNQNTDFLETKINAVEMWVNNMKSLKPTLVLPELENITTAWETPRNGNRFKILKLCFKDGTGLDTMKDLLYGSKLDLLEGLPRELEKIREQIYVSVKHSFGRRYNQNV